MPRGWTYLVIGIVIFAAAIRILSIQYYNIPFTMDQGRDMLDIREIAVGFKPRLIGPTTSINGVFLGPFWYYFNLPPFLLGKGDPSFLVAWMIILYVSAGVVLWLFFQKRDRLLALIMLSFYFFSPALFYPSRFSWSANPMPPFTIFYFLSVFWFLDKPAVKKAFLIGLVCGLAFQIEAAFAVLFLPFAILVFLYKRVGIKYLFNLIASFSLTLIPQVIFEFRHGFIMTNTFLREISGESATLGEKLSFLEAIKSHLEVYTLWPSNLLNIPYLNGVILMIAAASFLFYKVRVKTISETSRTLFNFSIAFILFSFVFYAFYPHALKGWFLLGLFIPIIFILSAFAKELIASKNLAVSVPSILFLLYLFTGSAFSQTNYIPKSQTDRSGDKSNLRNELSVIDWVYEKAEGKPFKVYNYIPSVYDYPYQYLFWWHGGNKFGYHPDKITYKDGVPEYIPDNEKYLDKRKTADVTSPIFLIYEEDGMIDRLYAWRGNFTRLCPKTDIKFTFGTTVEMLYECEKKLN